METIHPEVQKKSAIERVIDKYVGAKSGRTVCCICGIHGNEHASIHAVHRVFKALHSRKNMFSGKFIALAGNLPALQKNLRFIDEDMNRLWRSDKIQFLRQDLNGHTVSNEESQAKALIKALEKEVNYENGSTIFLDMHTTSSRSKPFIIFGDTLRNRRIAANFKVPYVLGLEEAIPGTIMEYITECGHIGMAFEAGKHDDPASIDIHEAALWLLLESIGCIRKGDFVEELSRSHFIMANASNDLPSILEVRYRHAIESTDMFEMLPGYKNFQSVKQGELLARDKNGSILAKEMGHILMPLYQGLGNDGFFMTRPINKFWLRVSTVMRYIQVNKLVHFLPGVTKHPAKKNTLIVDTHVAKWFVVEIFHLLGFRRITQLNKRTVILTKRRYDIFGPYRPCRN
ncbi:MAG: succinylglutamate desuccinylase/aspartoacylase family protein [Deferribacteres bacterium]|nr:succinylglutamate desuccinylase/aspartoacylase family protein [candidate division KSB1 bacterium]MCB9502143.1 succinylglutamate desuccinylase/aspartoacylase family protein [Deferribacteres bacterium]